MAVISSSEWTMSSSSADTCSPADDLKTNVVFFSHDAPSEGVPELFRQLHQRTKEHTFATLNAFLSDCTYHLREELAKLPQHLQHIVPHFSNVHTLAESFKDLKHTPLGGAVENALLCTLELAILIGHYEYHKLEYNLSKQGTILSGLGIGLLASVAISSASSLAEISSTGVECVRAAFRLGIRVEQISQSLEPRGLDGNRASWAYVVSGQSLQDIQNEIKQYNSETSRNGPSQICVSAVDRMSTVVTGPPARLKAMFHKSDLLRQSKHSPLPVHTGICHAPHVYCSEDVTSIMEGLREISIRSRPLKLTLLSSQTGTAFSAGNTGELIAAVCLEILTGTMHLDDIVGGVVHNVSGRPSFQILTFNNSIITQGILNGIEAALPATDIGRLDLLKWSTQKTDATRSGSSAQAKLAVVGMACRLPGGADDLERFWELMMNQQDVHSKIPVDRFDINTHVDPTGRTPNASDTPYGNFIQNPGLFDAGFFYMSPKEAEQTDPMQRLALVTAYEALEMSGYAPGRTFSTNLKRTGTFYGQASDDWREVNSSQNIGTYGLPGGERAFANGRINYFFKFGGPSFNVDTACSSGLAAVQAACSALWADEADMVVAGGLNVITNSDIYCMLSRGHFLSKTGQCKVWDQSADGYCRADGVGSVVIKRLEDAERDNDNIIAVIAAAATNHSAQSVSITQPHVGAQMDNYRQVLQAAGADPLDVSYIELHGTGTQVGDAVESESVARTFAPRTPARPADQRLHLGAVKSNIGHGEAAAGITSLIKVLMTFEKNQIPPQVPMPTIMNSVVAKNLERRNMGMVTSTTPWTRPAGKKRYAIVNSFGAHGGNTTLLLEDGPQRTKGAHDPRSFHVVTLSAKSKRSLEENARSLLQHLRDNPQTNLADLSYTTCARRIHHSLRVAMSVSTTDQLLKFLEDSTEAANSLRPVPLDSPTIAFAFTGQGAFYEGMGKQLFQDFPLYRSAVIDLDRILNQLGFPSILPTINGGGELSDNPTITQLAILVTEIALIRFLDLLGVRPNVVIGHSLGEYAALVAASVISAADALFLVGRRTELMLAHCAMRSHIMMTVKADVETIEKLAKNHHYEISCINGREETVISGSKEHITQVREILNQNGLKAMLLEVPFAFHTSQLDPILDEFENIASRIAFKAPSIPIISPTISACVFDGETINARYLRQASRTKVDFLGALEAARELGIVDDKTIWIDIGPHPVCAALIRRHSPSAKTATTFRKDEDNWRSLTSTLAMLHVEGTSVCWNEFFRPYESGLSLLQLPRYQWNEKNYWIPYVGTWTLDKAYPEGRPASNVGTDKPSALRPTSSVQRVISETILERSGTLITLSDVMQPELLTAFEGHQMNGFAVASTTIWVDMGLTMADYLYRRLVPKAVGYIPMNFSNMEVQYAQVLPKNRTASQYIQTEASIDLDAKKTIVLWFDVASDGSRATTHFASATIHYENSELWEEDWERMAHLISGRIEALTHNVDGPRKNVSTTSRLSCDMTYALFQNVVNYAIHFRGMRSVILSGFEATADVVLDGGNHGSWYAPPHWTDPACHLSGFIMNGSDSVNTRDFFYVTHGWESWRALEPLQSDVEYKSYVKMVPVKDEAHMYAGDVYIMREDRIITVINRMRFKRIPRQLMKNFFSPGQGLVKDHHKLQPSSSYRKDHPPHASGRHSSIERASTPLAQSPTREIKVPVPSNPIVNETSATAKPDLEPEAPNSTVVECIKLIARESGLDMSELGDSATFNELGVDSLMSLVLSEKFASELGLEVKSSVFLECQNIGELKAWLMEMC